MKGKTCLVTGANSGLGFESVRALVAAGARVVMLCRNPDKGTEALEAVRAEHPQAELALEIADLADLDAVRGFTDRWQGRLDVLLANAGLLTLDRQETAQGFEAMFGVNHLANVVLIKHLLKHMGAGGRLVLVSSGAHKAVKRVNFDDLQSERSFRIFRAYGQSKLAVMLYGLALGSELEQGGVTFNSVHPGGVATNLGSSNKWWIEWVRPLTRFVLKSAVKAAQTQVMVVADPDLTGVTGKYFANMKAATPSQAALDEQAAVRVRTVSEDLVARWL